MYPPLTDMMQFFKIVDSQKPRCTFACNRVELISILRRVSNATV